MEERNNLLERDVKRYQERRQIERQVGVFFISLGTLDSANGQRTRYRSSCWS